jgi:hypothetical protein
LTQNRASCSPSTVLEAARAERLLQHAGVSDLPGDVYTGM